MATYGYTAINKAGKERKGSIDADNMEKAKAELRNQGLTILKISEQSFWSKEINIAIGGKPKPRDFSVFCRQFVSMSKAGVPIWDIFKMLVETTENKKLKNAFQDVKASIEKGEPLSNAFAENPKIFPELLISMVATGEATGSIEMALERMALQFERSSKTKGMVRKALMYPAIIMAVAFIVVILMLVLVIPSYADMFREMGTDLPTITKVVVGISDFLITKWFIIVPVVFGIIFGITTFARTKRGKYFFGGLALKMPFIRTITVKGASAQMARTLGSLLGAGVPLVNSVEIVANTMNNIYFKESLLRAKEEIIVGQPLSRSILEEGFFPAMVYHMVRIGEETGNNEEMLEKLADYYEEEVELEVGTLMAALEPMIIILLAIIVIPIIAACLAPMMKMYDTLNTL